MEKKEMFSGKFIVEKGSGFSAKTGKPYDMYFLVIDTPIGERRFLINGRTEMGIVISTICQMY